MEYGADKYCKEKAAIFQDRINHLSVEPLGRELDCILGKYYTGYPFALPNTETDTDTDKLTRNLMRIWNAKL